MRLGVNIDHIATVRQARRGSFPDPVEAALLCERAGATSIVCHLREDRRHIQDHDVKRLKQAISTYLNLEMSTTKDIVRAALTIKSAQVTLVPERRQELTTEGGLDVQKRVAILRPVVRQLREQGIEVSLFVDPVIGQLKAVRDVGATIAELHTGRYAEACSPSARARQLETLANAARGGKALGLAIAAGHGLDFENVREVAAIPEIEELNIGFSIISRALFVGIEQAVKEMVVLVQSQPVHAV